MGVKCLLDPFCLGFVGGYLALGYIEERIIDAMVPFFIY